MSLLNHELIHFFVTLLVSFFIYWKYKKISLVIVVYAVGIFLDIDHLFDLLAAGGNLSQISQGLYFSSSGKVYVILHSWELLIPWWIYIAYSKKYDLGWTVTLAFIAHILVDQLSYPTYPLTYFISFRAMHNFNLGEIFK